MAVTKTWGFTNTTNSASSITPKQLGLVSNYALLADEPTECTLTNLTSPVDQAELITFRCKKIPTVNTGLTVQYPNLVKAGVQYSATLETSLRVTAEDGVITDHPIVVYTTLRHDASGDISDDDVKTVLIRALSALIADDGEWRLGRLRRSALKPTAD